MTSKYLLLDLVYFLSKTTISDKRYFLNFDLIEGDINPDVKTLIETKSIFRLLFVQETFTDGFYYLYIPYELDKYKFYFNFFIPDNNGENILELTPDEVSFLYNVNDILKNNNYEALGELEISRLDKHYLKLFLFYLLMKYNIGNLTTNLTILNSLITEILTSLGNWQTGLLSDFITYELARQSMVYIEYNFYMDVR